MTDTDDQAKIALAREYFRLVDAGDPALLDIFTEDAQIYFPKFGLAKGKPKIMELATGLGKEIREANHDTRNYLFLPFGQHLAVEGTTTGVTTGGVRWAAGESPAGRFCNIFEFRDEKISRVHVYLDPDYGGQDEGRFHWGREDRQW